MKNIILKIGFLISFGIFLVSCESTSTAKERPWLSRPAPSEAEWIRNGEPVEFEGELWYPADSIENLLDSEVYKVGEYRDVQIFIEYTDVRPYDRLYTRFSKNKYRFFEKRQKND